MSVVEEKEKDDFATCFYCSGNFHRTVLKSVDIGWMCPTCAGKHELPVVNPTNKQIRAYHKGMSVLGPRIKILRQEAYKLEVAYAKMFNRKRRLEEQLTVVTKLPTIKPGTPRNKQPNKVSVEQLVAQMDSTQMKKMLALLEAKKGVK